MPQFHKSSQGMKGFTLIELLVVVAIIALLISILIPSLGQARQQAQTAACSSNQRQVYLALRMYQDEYGGWLPTGKNGSMWSEAAWWVKKSELWFYMLTPKYLGNPAALICPGDPFKTEFDYEAAVPGEGPRTDVRALASGYGMNYLLRHWAYEVGPGTWRSNYLMNTDRYAPKWPSKTILMADVGPDDGLQLAPLNGSDEDTSGTPWRDGGRLVWDDGNRAWYIGPTWLTARHLGKINMTTVDGVVKAVPTVKQLKEEVKSWYPECLGFNFMTRTYVCPLCAQGTSSGSEPVPHYNFSESQLWWWTGKPPAP